jgi:ArsR family transcriptional regulator
VFYRLAGAGPDRGPPARALVHQILALIAPDDGAFARDAERLAGVSEERSSQAAAYFAENAEHWHEIRSLHTAEAEVESAIQRAVGEGPFERVVDLGTGAGRMLTLLGERARSAIGLDLSRQMLNIARDQVAAAGLAACELRHGDILGTGLPDGCADLVLVHQVLHYLADPAAAVAEAARLVSPGGRLLIVDFAPHDLEFLRAEHRHRRLGFSDGEIERWFAANGLAAFESHTLPPAADGGLTVKIWAATRDAALVRLIA